MYSYHFDNGAPEWIARQRAIQYEMLQKEPVPEHHWGFIEEVNTSLGRDARPARWQLVLGSMQPDEMECLEKGRVPAEGSIRLGAGLEEIFVPCDSKENNIPDRQPPPTVYTDPALHACIAPLGKERDEDVVFRHISHADPMRLRQHSNKEGRKIRRYGEGIHAQPAQACTTKGDSLPAQTFAGQPLWPHMLVRLWIPSDYSWVVACSSIAVKQCVSSDDVFTRRQMTEEIRYRILFCPR